MHGATVGGCPCENTHPPRLAAQLRPMSASAQAIRLRRRSTCLWLMSLRRLELVAFCDRIPKPACRALSPSVIGEILLELYVAGLERRQLYQSSLAPTEPSATIHRLVARLEGLGAVARSLDPSDHRRLNVVLTPAMQSVLDEFIDAVEAAMRNFFPPCR